MAARPQRSRAPMALAAVAVVAILVTVAAALLWPDRAHTPGTAGGASSQGPSARPSASTADVSRLPIARTLSCSQIGDAQVRTALAGSVAGQREYGNGDRVEIVPGVMDVSHEYGCTFRGTGADVRVWVFAAPVTADRARTLVRDVRAQRGCTFPADTTRFGNPTITDVCVERPAGQAEPTVTATLRGLFGDAWLSCQVAARDGASSAAVTQRADRWCLHVATVLGARP